MNNLETKKIEAIEASKALDADAQPAKTIAQKREDYLAAKDNELIEALNDRGTFHTQLIHELIEGEGCAIIKASDRSINHFIHSSEAMAAEEWWWKQGVAICMNMFGLLLKVPGSTYVVEKTKCFDYAKFKEEW